MRFRRKIKVLGHKLLHKSNINVAIANILLHGGSAQDLQKSRYGVLARISQCFPSLEINGRPYFSGVYVASTLQYKSDLIKDIVV